MLKKLIMSAGFVALIASSAMAQSYQPEWGSGNIVPNIYPQPSTPMAQESFPDSDASQKPALHRHAMKHHLDDSQAR